MKDQFDLIVLGSGAAGATPANSCRAAGWRVAVVDDQPFGGTCGNRGCDPKKVLVGAADVVSWARRMRGYGVAGEAAIDWPALIAFKRSFTDPVPASREGAFQKAGIETLHGEARFVATDRIAVGARELMATHFVIATGASPRRLDIPGEEHVITSTDFMELDALPRRIVFIGAGYISLAFAHLAHQAGAEVTVVGRGRPLPTFEEALVDRLLAHSRQIGIDVRLDHSVSAVERGPESAPFRVHVGHGANLHAIDADLVVHGAGRIPNSARLGAAAGEIALEHHGSIRVNEFLQSVSNARVYAAGDVVSPPGGIPLTPVAGHEGSIVATNLLEGNSARPDLRAIASVVFTLPALASVGLTEKAARAKGMQLRIASGDTTQWYTNRRIREPVGTYKTIIDEATDRVVGAHLLGAQAEEVINLFAMAIRFEVPITELKKMLFAYPTGGSNLSYML
ncbi:MAG: NAD(P)/FAD-dependent oxidoreductase [Gemmatimonadaceae bacterium]|nr:NAD(P)/FAD-dependent oxidoreductase [Gemmatimonadaceae bacterium]